MIVFCYCKIHCSLRTALFVCSEETVSFFVLFVDTVTTRKVNYFVVALFLLTVCYVQEEGYPKTTSISPLSSSHHHLFFLLSFSSHGACS